MNAASILSGVAGAQDRWEEEDNLAAREEDDNVAAALAQAAVSATNETKGDSKAPLLDMMEARRTRGLAGRNSD